MIPFCFTVHYGLEFSLKKTSGKTSEAFIHKALRDYLHIPKGFRAERGVKPVTP